MIVVPYDVVKEVLGENIDEKIRNAAFNIPDKNKLIRKEVFTSITKDKIMEDGRIVPEFSTLPGNQYKRTKVEGDITCVKLMEKLVRNGTVRYKVLKEKRI